MCIRRLLEAESARGRSGRYASIESADGREKHANSKRKAQCGKGRASTCSGNAKRDLKQLIRLGHQTQHPDGREVVVEGSGVGIGFHVITAGEARVTRGTTVRRT